MPPPDDIRNDALSDVQDVLVVGSGAAGLATGIFTRRANPRLSVRMLEGAKRPGAKILVSGGSRCNVTNVAVSERDFWGGRAAIIRRVLRAFPAADAAAFFRAIGVPLHEEADGKLFPDSNRSRDVLDALLREADRCGAMLMADHRVMRVSRDAGGFRVQTNRREFRARRVVLATGGRSLPKTGSDGGGLEIARTLGHPLVPTTPALAPLVLDAAFFHRDVAGVSHEAEIAIWIDGAVSVRLRGALLWTHFGVSGPVALNASRHWCRGRAEDRRVALTVNFNPGRSFDDVDRELVDAAAAAPRSPAQKLLAARMPASIASAVVAAAHVDAASTLAHLTREQRRAVAHAVTALPLPVVDTRGYNFAEATAGGVALDEIDPNTLESRVCEGLYLVGEMLDVDGRIGGFNFQWAWSSAYVAARALAGGPRARTGS